MIPVAIVTGFLGSGKTTLISRILRDPAFARTAVIVNEFGEIGLDHELIASSDETLLALTTGCLCCAVRSDLVATLLDLQRRREAGEIAYDRVLIETSGLADPAPILHALMTDRDIAQHHAIDGIVTVVDALHGEATLDRHAEARRQAALADNLLLSKTDLARPVRRAARTPCRAQSGRTRSASPAMSRPATCSPARMPRRASRRCPISRRAIRSPARSTRDGIETFALQRDRAIPALALTLLLEALAEHCGARLLRMKGLVHIEEMPGRARGDPRCAARLLAARISRPLAIAPTTAPAMVFITQGVPRHFPARLLDAIEHEVREAMEEAASLR